MTDHSPGERVDPRGADLKRFLADEPDPDHPGPVVMLNLLRFLPGGRDSYERYVAEFTKHSDRFGAQTLYVGDASTVLVAPDGHEWDVLLVVRYPTRQAFSDMVADPEYQKITHLRTQALDAAVLQATTPWS